MSTTRISVGGDYDVVIGTGLLDELPGLVGEGSSGCSWCTPGRWRRRGRPCVRTCWPRATRRMPRRCRMPRRPRPRRSRPSSGACSGRRASPAPTRSWRSGAGPSRTSPVSWQRPGCAAYAWCVPTTLLGMVDAAVGGKTGINTPEGRTSSVPSTRRRACCATSPPWRRCPPTTSCGAGGGHQVRLHRGPGHPRPGGVRPRGVRSVGGSQVRELVERAVRVKADVVAQDLRESSLREILNYGHTFGHAVEQVERYQFQARRSREHRHGLRRRARQAGWQDRRRQRHRSVLSSVGLPVSYRGDRWPRLLDAMRRDKKSRGSLLRFVVLAGLARPVRLEGPDPALLQAAYAEISTDAVERAITLG